MVQLQKRWIEIYEARKYEIAEDKTHSSRDFEGSWSDAMDMSRIINVRSRRNHKSCLHKLIESEEEAYTKMLKIGIFVYRTEGFLDLQIRDLNGFTALDIATQKFQELLDEKKKVDRRTGHRHLSEVIYTFLKSIPLSWNVTEEQKKAYYTELESLCFEVFLHQEIVRYTLLYKIHTHVHTRSQIKITFRQKIFERGPRNCRTNVSKRN